MSPCADYTPERAAGEARVYGTMAPTQPAHPRKEQTMTGWAWMAIGAAALAVVIMQIAMRIK